MQIIVSVDVPSLNMNPAVWGDDATKFRPHRHLQETPEYSNHGFGLGPRKCLAIFFTSVVQRLLIVSSLHLNIIIIIVGLHSHCCDRFYYFKNIQYP